MNRVEKLLKVALFTLQQVIKKGEDQEELENFQKNIKTRETINIQTHSILMFRFSSVQFFLYNQTELNLNL